MKKERYFRHELERMFIAYAIVPAVVFTLVCGLLFMTVLLHGKKSGNIEHSRYVAGLLDNVLARYEDGVEEMASQPGLLDRVRDQDGKAELSGIFYGITNSLGLEGDLFVMDSSRNILLSSRSDLPPFLDVPEGVSWGIFDDMDREPNRTALKLAEGWKNGGSTIVIGRSVMDGNKKQGYILCSIPSSQFKALVDKPDIQTIIADPFGWAYVSSNYSFLNSSNQVMKVLMESGRYLSHKKQMYLVSRQRVPRGGFTVYSISDIQNIVISLGLGSGLVITALVLMTLWMLLNSRKVTEIKTEDFYKILDVMENARDGDLEGVIRIHSDNEFKIIADAYNETIQSLRIQMENNRKMAELVSMAQNKQLESQFNPHFLYNTLDSIIWSLRMRQVEESIEMLTALTDFFKISLSKGRDIITIEEEVKHIKSYLSIQHRRYQEKFDYDINVDPAILSCRTPKLILQPAVENAIYHGIKPMEEKGYIYIHIFPQGGDVLLQVQDTGMGMDKDACSRLNRELDTISSDQQGTGYGVRNVNDKIKIVYGRRYGVTIESAMGEGTVVTLRIGKKGETSDESDYL